MSDQEILLFAILVLLSVVFLLLIHAVYLVTKSNISLSEFKHKNEDFLKVIQIPQTRGFFGEKTLQWILEDQLPSDMYCIRKKCLDGKIPDAYIKTEEGLLCIDSKFPLENFVKMYEYQNEKEIAKKFEMDVRKHLEKIHSDYVRPELGSADFAIAYLPAESIYYYLISQESQLIYDYIKRSVIVTSPLAFAFTLQQIKYDNRNNRLNENAQEALDRLNQLSNEFKQLDRVWDIFNTHLRNLNTNEAKIDDSYKKLRKHFAQITKDYFID